MANVTWTSPAAGYSTTIQYTKSSSLYFSAISNDTSYYAYRFKLSAGNKKIQFDNGMQVTYTSEFASRDEMYDFVGITALSYTGSTTITIKLQGSTQGGSWNDITSPASRTVTINLAVCQISKPTYTDQGWVYSPGVSRIVSSAMSNWDSNKMAFVAGTDLIKTDAGNYNAGIKTKDGYIFNDSGSLMYQYNQPWSIAKADPDYNAPTIKDDVRWDNDTHMVCSLGSVTAGGTMYYKIDDGDWVTDAIDLERKDIKKNNQGNAIPYSVKFYISETTNYNGVSDSSSGVDVGDFTILYALQQVSMAQPSGTYYTQTSYASITSITGTIAESGTIGKTSESNCTVSISQNNIDLTTDKYGTASVVIYIGRTTHYDRWSETLTITVNRKSQEWDLSPTSFTIDIGGTGFTQFQNHLPRTTMSVTGDNHTSLAYSIYPQGYVITGVSAGDDEIVFSTPADDYWDVKTRTIYVTVNSPTPPAVNGIRVYKNGWHTATPWVYKNGSWYQASVWAYKNGAWHKIND